MVEIVSTAITEGQKKKKKEQVIQEAKQNRTCVKRSGCIWK